MKRWIIAAVVLGAATAGCNQPTVQEAKVQAYKRWYNTRAQILCGVGKEQFDVGQLERAQVKAQEALALDEEYIEARMLLAKVYIEQGKYASGIAELEKVVRQDPALAEAFYLLGVAHEKERKLDQALVNYRKAQALDALDVHAALAAAEVLVMMGRMDEACQQVDACLVTAADEPGVHELAGRLAMARKDYAKAVKCYQQAHDLEFRNLRYLELLAGAQFAAGKHSAAADSLNRLLESKDYTPGAWAYTMLGDCQIARGRHYEARDAYRKASELAPQAVESWTNMARAALAVGDTARAILSARQGLYLDGQSLDAAMLLGYALLRDGNTAEALSVLNKAVERHGDSSMLQCLLGRAYAARGEQEQALRCYRQALSLEPGNDLAKELAASAQASRIPS